MDDSGVDWDGPAGNISGMGKVLIEWAAAKGPAGLEAYQRENNVRGIDGLPTPITGPTPT